MRLQSEISCRYSADGLTSPAVNGLNGVDHKEPEFEGGEVENTPEVRADVAREADRKDEEELPESGELPWQQTAVNHHGSLGLAKNLLTRFKSIESQKPTEYKPSGVGSKVRLQLLSENVHRM